MVKELEVHILEKNAREQQIEHAKPQKPGSSLKDPVIMGGQQINEEEFDDEKLCQICCFMQIDTEFVPCQH